MTDNSQLNVIFQCEEAKSCEFVSLLKLLSNAEKNTMNHLSFNMLKRSLSCNKNSDAELLDIFLFAVQVGILVKKYEYCDLEDADEAQEISEEHITQAAKKGYLEIEDSGLKDPEYKSKVSLFFKANISKARDVWDFYEATL